MGWVFLGVPVRQTSSFAVGTPLPRFGRAHRVAASGAQSLRCISTSGLIEVRHTYVHVIIYGSSELLPVFGVLLQTTRGAQ